MQATEMSGKSQFPFLVDPNNGKEMLESDAIIEYLWNEYGDGKVHFVPFRPPDAMHVLHIYDAMFNIARPEERALG